MLEAMIDRRFIARSDGAWQLRHLPAWFTIPDSIESILAARIDLLGPAEKAALQAASVAGRVFWAGPVLELLGGIETDLGVLVEPDFIRRRPWSSMPVDPPLPF